MALGGTRGGPGVVPLLVCSAVVVMVSVGLTRGLWLPNAHNGLLALSFVLVGSYVLSQRPGHATGRLFLLTGTVQAVLFLGRQIGHAPTSAGDRWWGWLGVWPTAVSIVLATLSVLCFPTGRLPSPRWRWVAGAAVLLATACAGLSATWPVEYASTAVVTAHPLNGTAPAAATAVWSAIAHPLYAGLQVLWVVVVAVRWRTAGTHVRRQLRWLVSAAALSLLALLAGLLVSGSPRAGLLAATLVPLAAGWAVVHGQHAAAYAALSWLSRADADPSQLPGDLAAAVAEALSAPAATLWVGNDQLHALGVWPESDDVVAPTSIGALEASDDRHVRVVLRRGSAVGALSVERSPAEPLSVAERRLLDDLVSHAALVIDHLGLADLADRRRTARHVDRLSPREREVLDLMARGRSNAAICRELHLSIKTVEPIVSTIFTKLDLHADAASNRRVLAVLAYVSS